METAPTDDRTNSVNYFRPIWARRWLIAIIVVIATAGTYVYYNGKPRVYGSASTLFVGADSGLDAAIAGQVSSNPDRTITDLARLISSPPVYLAAERLTHGRIQLAPISASASSGSDFIELSATAPTPTDAAATVNAYAQAFINFRAQTVRQQAAVALAQVEKQLAQQKGSPNAVTLQEEISQLKDQEASPAAGLQQIAAAPVDPTPLSPNPKKDALFALALSLMLGMAIAYGLDRLDHRVRGEEELQLLYGAPIVGELPHVPDPAPDRDGVPCVHPDQWESFRALKTNLELASGSKPLRTLLVASAQTGEGKSLVTRNLALAYADAGSRVVVVEGDLRRPTLARLLNVEHEPGLTDVLVQVELLPEAVQSVGRLPVRELPSLERGGVAVKPTRRTGTVDVVTSGEPTERLTAGIAAEGIRSVIARLTEEYDIVLVDSAPLLAVSDSVPLAGAVDGVVVVARLGLTTTHGARRVSELLERVPGARVLGVVANCVPKRPFQYGGGYSA